MCGQRGPALVSAKEFCLCFDLNMFVVCIVQFELWPLACCVGFVSFFGGTFDFGSLARHGPSLDLDTRL